jgi:thiosulfate dehydrogenase [quinone] large subunit
VIVQGEAHSLGVWFVVALRLIELEAETHDFSRGFLTMAYAFLHAGVGKFLGAEPFSAQGYLLFGAAESGSPLAGLYVWMGSTPWFVEFVNVAVPFGQVAIGLGLLFGVLTRLAAFFGAFMMLMFYFGNWDVTHGLVNGDFAYMLVFLAVAALGAGRVLGLDAIIERYQSAARH